MELRTKGMAHGGSAVARVDGKAYFVDGALPGELVSGKVTVDKGSWGKVDLEAVIEQSADRVAPKCDHFDTCGGCQWQFANYEAQLAWKQSIIAGQLAHLGRVVDPPVRKTVPAGPPFGYRNRMDFRVIGGRPALHERGSHRLTPISQCEILHPNLADLFPDLGDLSGVDSLTLRTSTTTGAVLAIIDGKVPAHVAAWGCNVARKSGDDVTPVRGDPVLEETVGGVNFRITGTAFFQNNTAGAERLVDLVAEAASVSATDTMLDAYAGGGLFAATVGRGAARVVAIERDRVAATDLQANLNRAGVADYRIIQTSTEEAMNSIDEYWDVVVADPPRKGLGIDGVDAVTAARPRTVVYVSCDPASLARDTALLDDIGYELELVTPVDMFPQTFHVEAVARFTRID